MIGLIWILIFLVIFLITQIRESQEIKSDNKQTEKHKKQIIIKLKQYETDVSKNQTKNS